MEVAADGLTAINKNADERESSSFHFRLHLFLFPNAVSEHRLAACAVAADNIHSGRQLNSCCVAAVDKASCQVVYAYGQLLWVVQHAALYADAFGH